MKHRRVLFHRIRDFKQYYVNSILPTVSRDGTRRPGRRGDPSAHPGPGRPPGAEEPEPQRPSAKTKTPNTQVQQVSQLKHDTHKHKQQPRRPSARRGVVREIRKGTNGVNTNGVTANFKCFDRDFLGTPLTFFFPNLSTFITFAAAPLVLTPFVRNQVRETERCPGMPAGVQKGGVRGQRRRFSPGADRCYGRASRDRLGGVIHATRIRLRSEHD